ncbi:MAG TPA: hypothetical protein VLA52_05250 [Thermohalobaculum sp.]|nr:hypothetical protein [Thermohalobaculum sp.]
MTDAPVPSTVIEAMRPHRSLWYDVWAQFRTHRGALAGVAVFLVIILAVAIGPYFHTIDPTYLDYRAKNLGPTWEHPFGTDNLGRDMLAQTHEHRQKLEKRAVSRGVQCDQENDDQGMESEKLAGAQRVGGGLPDSLAGLPAKAEQQAADYDDASQQQERSKEEAGEGGVAPRS